MTVHAYLNFNGNCREAMTFYQKCLGGALSFQTIGESPLSKQMPEKMKNCILHSTLSKGNLALMASDMVSEAGLFKGNAVSLLLNCASEQELKSCYKKLSSGAKRTGPVKENIWGKLMGCLTDKYGNNWVFINHKNK